MAASPRNFISCCCETKDKGGLEELRREGKDVVAVKMVYRPVSFSKVRNRRPDCCGNITTRRAHRIVEVEATGEVGRN